MDNVDRQGLHFFGSVTASVSHELKNALAIIAQNAGLLQDYLAMAASGRPVEPARFDILARRIEEQTRRADKLIKYLNRFAHTVDDFCKSIDLNDMLDLLELLSARVAAMRQAELVCRIAPQPVVVNTAPFLLLTLLGRLLWSHLHSCQTGHTVVVGVKATTCAQIYIEAPAGLAEVAESNFAVEERAALLAELNANARVDPDQGRTVITLNQPVHSNPEL